MKHLNHLFAAAACVAAAVVAAPAMAMGDCGKVQIADMNWASATFIAHADKKILEAMGCEVELVPGDTMPTGTSMTEKGQPDVAPELWINALREALDKAVAEKRLEYANYAFLDGGEEGFWVPQYMVDEHPELATIEGVLSHPELFPHPEDKSKGLFMGCPAGWNCQITSGNLFKAFGMEDKGFLLGDPGTAAGLDGSLAKAYERKEGWFGYYWAPTAFLGKFDMVKVDFGVEHNKEEWDKCTTVADCLNPKPNAWSLSEVFTVTTTELEGKSPTAYNYFKRRGYHNKFLNRYLKWIDENQATGEEAAENFLREHEEVWTPWVSAAVAQKVRESL
jgi:glycine betaine/proline transport system substrate-binding protein